MIQPAEWTVVAIVGGLALALPLLVAVAILALVAWAAALLEPPSDDDRF